VSVGGGEKIIKLQCKTFSLEEIIITNFNKQAQHKATLIVNTSDFLS
jgi:hypothetical protein